MDETEEPVAAAAEESRDLYEIASWEERTSIDGAAVALYWLLTRAAKWIVVLLALAILAGIGGLAALSDPAVGMLTLLSVVPAAGLTLYVYRSDITDAEPLTLLVTTFLLSILFATFAAVFNSTAEQFFPDMVVDRVDRNIQRREVVFDDPFDFFFRNIVQRYVITIEETEPVIVVLAVKRTSHTRGHLVHEAEDAFTPASLEIHLLEGYSGFRNTVRRDLDSGCFSSWFFYQDFTTFLILRKKEQIQLVSDLSSLDPNDSVTGIKAFDLASYSFYL